MYKDIFKPQGQNNVKSKIVKMKSVPDCNVNYILQCFIKTLLLVDQCYILAHILLLCVCIYNLYTPSLLSLIS